MRSEKEKRNSGHHGLGPAPLASRPNPRAPKGLGLEANRPRNARPVLRPGTPKGLGPEASRLRTAQLVLHPSTPKEKGSRASWPRNARLVLCPSGRVSHIRMPFYPGVSLPDRQLHQTKLPTGSSRYKYKVSHESVCSPPRE